ncbi:cystatin-like [Erpetoichthys calabaricus]|uniref:Cystatin-like n=1 Tax=Erpetoichthys calabaricus TaxID=27687 RepID=A0A8C4SQ00_ERPCA|nr:cystatin-like [Erpetoichthys calabaricus]XP_051775282.1 cystatin-like [Erpetoichthys calabaricus]
MAYIWPKVGLLLLSGLLSVYCQNPGSPQPVPVNGTDVVNASEFAVQEFNDKYNKDDYIVLQMEILNATQQVVSGLMYYLEVAIQCTYCKKREPINSACTSCNGQKVCHFQVWEQAWLDSIELVKADCPSDWS